MPVVIKCSKAKEVSLGPRLLIHGEHRLGTCDNLIITVAEATEEEIQEMIGAREVRLVKIGKG